MATIPVPTKAQKTIFLIILLGFSRSLSSSSLVNQTANVARLARTAPIGISQMRISITGSV
jgi:hypothetical protein